MSEVSWLLLDGGMSKSHAFRGEAILAVCGHALWRPAALTPQPGSECGHCERILSREEVGVVETKRRTRAACSVVNQGCRYPPATFGKIGTMCFACGQNVCSNYECSRRISWFRYGRRRVCTSCIEDSKK